MGKIIDKKSAREWMLPQPLDIRAYVASRAALRVFPVLVLTRQSPYEEFDRVCDQRKVVTLPTLFGLAFSSASSTYPQKSSSSLEDASDLLQAALDHWSGETYSSHDPSTSKGDDAATDVIVAACDAIQSRIKGYGASAASAIVLSARAASRAVALKAGKAGLSPDEIAARADAASVAIFAATTWDAKDTEKNWSPLWPAGISVPQELLELWDTFKAHLSKTPEEWEFWIKWYDAIHAGHPVAWDVVYKIASEIESDEWNPCTGAAITTQRIKRIMG